MAPLAQVVTCGQLQLGDVARLVWHSRALQRRRRTTALFIDSDFSDVVVGWHASWLGDWRWCWQNGHVIECVEVDWIRSGNHVRLRS